MIKILNWQDFQHYKNRRPPWIKLYRALLDKKEWRALSDFSARLLVELWLLAAENNDGIIDLEPDALAWRLRYASNMLAKIESALQELATEGFIEYASNMLAGCKQHAIPEREVETEKEGETKGPAKINWNEIKVWWNALAPACGLPQVQRITDTRKRHYRSRLADYPDMKAIMEKELARLDSFVHEGGWMCFDWLMKSEANFTKLAEGNYRGKQKRTENVL